jgi:hypothetical protein
MTDKTQAIASLPDITSRGSESAQKTGTDDCDTEFTEVTAEVTNSRKKMRIDDKSRQDEGTDNDHPKLIKPHFSEKNWALNKSGWRESNPHDQLGRLELYH